LPDLPDPTRLGEVLILRDVLGFHAKEVAQVLDSTEESVTSTRAFEAQDVRSIVGLLTDDVWLTMPPIPLEWQGHDLADQFLTATAMPHVRRRLVADLFRAAADPPGLTCRSKGCPF
jgi:RNA polymerase sigma-70 factor (ECF subfamily)